MRSHRSLIVLGLFLASVFLPAYGQSLDGRYGASETWGSGWIDLDPHGSFPTDTCLRLKVGGTASKVVVRLLKFGDKPDEAAGVVGGITKVPRNREVVGRLTRSFENIVQISVHGGHHPWQFGLGKHNGPATLEAAYVIPCQK